MIFVFLQTPVSVSAGTEDDEPQTHTEYEVLLITFGIKPHLNRTLIRPDNNRLVPRCINSNTHLAQLIHVLRNQIRFAVIADRTKDQIIGMKSRRKKHRGVER